MVCSVDCQYLLIRHNLRRITEVILQTARAASTAEDMWAFAVTVGMNSQ
jgi:hypothetical protein